MKKLTGMILAILLACTNVGAVTPEAEELTRK